MIPPRPYSLFLEHGSAAKTFTQTLISHPRNSASYAGYRAAGIQSGLPVVYQRETLGKSFRYGTRASHTLPDDIFFHSKMWRVFHAVVLASFLTCSFAASNETIPAVLWHGMGT